MFRSACLTALLALASFSAQAQGYPSQTVRIIVGFPPGGTTDVIGRLVAQELTESLGRAVVVENRPGASGTIGGGIAAKSTPDGHTLLVVASTHGTAPALYASLPYEDKDLVPAALIATTPYVLVVHPSVPANNVKELIALLKANPDKYAFGSAGVGTSQHISGELFKTLAGVTMQHVPYRGSGPMIPELLGGTLPIAFDNITTVIQHIKAGKIRALAVTTTTRSSVAPDVPTMAESGLAGYELSSWQAAFAPAGTPRPIIDRLYTEISRILKMSDVAKRLTDLGLDISGMPPAELAALIKADVPRLGKIVKESGATAN